MIYQVHHLHCGSMRPLYAPLFGQKGAKAEIVCHCLLIETDQGLVLVDTGLGVQDYLHPQQRLGRLIPKLSGIQHFFAFTAIAQIQKLGFKSNDVKHILLSHLDFDHAGGISDFPDATVHVLSTEFNATFNSDYKSKMRYRPHQFQNHRYWNFLDPQPGDAWFNLTRIHSFQLFQDEILMIALPGHSAGHCGIAIRQATGWLLYCGDAYYCRLALNPNKKLYILNRTEQFLADNNILRLESLKKLQNLSKMHSEIEIICAHDPIELKHYQI